jgi:hypothetical protein
LQHARDLTVLIPPPCACFLIEVFEIRAIAQPNLHLIGRTNRHQEIALEFQIRLSLLAETFGKVRTDRFAGSPHMIGKTTIVRSLGISTTPDANRLKLHMRV